MSSWRIERRSAGRLLLVWNLALTLAVVALLLARSQPTVPLVSSTAHAVDDAAFVAKSQIADVAHRVSPSVVSVGAVKRVMVPDPSYNAFFNNFGMRSARAREPFMGSGAIIDEGGLIVTNYHVIEDSEEVFVTLSDAREFPATIVARDPYIDIALLRIDAPGLPAPLALGDADTLQIGETVIALGNPFGPLIADPRPTVTVGVVSALNRTFRPDVEHRRVYHNMIQTDAAINPGNSGGPLVDGNGALIGINTFIMTRSGGSQGIGFAIPITRVKSMLEEIRVHGRLRPIMLDFDLSTVRNRAGDGGALVEHVYDDGPAEAADLRVGDVIIGAMGRDVGSREDLILLLASRQVGDGIELKVWRDGATVDKQYEVSEAPAGK